MSLGTPVQQDTRPTDEFAIAQRARNADARRGRVVRALMLTVSLLYVLALLIAPLAGIVYNALKAGIGAIGDTFSQPDVLHAVYLTFLIMSITVVVTGVFGVIVALVLARDRFRGKRLRLALVDLPLAVSPVIVGLMAVLLFGPGGWFEPFFAARGIEIIFALPSMILVTIFISIPFVIREVLPVLRELGTEEEDAARTLGASVLQSVPTSDLAEHPVGPLVRGRALRGPSDRRDRRRARRERAHPGPDRDGHAVHLPGRRETRTRFGLRRGTHAWRRSRSCCS